MARFEKVWCSQCGEEFGPRDSGYSHCQDHLREESQDYLREEIARLKDEKDHLREEIARLKDDNLRLRQYVAEAIMSLKL